MSEPPTDASDESHAEPVRGVGGARPVAKVVPLRGIRVECVAREVPRMLDMMIDLQAPIDSLRLIKSDLEAYFWDYPVDDEARCNERYQISYWIRQVADRTAALEAVLMHKGAVRLAQVQRGGRRPMPAAEFLRGLKLRAGTALA